MYGDNAAINGSSAGIKGGRSDLGCDALCAVALCAVL